MPVFLSYSQIDSDFATRLAAQLVKHRTHVWIDQWELHVGDSIVDRIQEAISGASALVVILSKHSVQSEWCRKELSAGLLRELEERRVVVLPVLIDDCEIPLFLRGKLYADFRRDFDTGLRAVLEAVARVTSDTLGRIDAPEWHVDWGIDWGLVDDALIVQVTLVEQARAQPYTVLTQLTIKANSQATSRYVTFAADGLDWVERGAIIEALAEGTRGRELRIVLSDEHVQTRTLVVQDTRLGTRYDIAIGSRRLGEDTGRDILLDIGGQIQRFRESQRSTRRPLSRNERAVVERIQGGV